MDKHTPGPWGLMGRTVYALNEEGINRFSTHVEGGFCVGRLRTTTEELAANARLIAAAPELLEALTDLLAMNDQLQKRPSQGGGVLPVDVGVTMYKARSAIAKATGAE